MRASEQIGATAWVGQGAASLPAEGQLADAALIRCAQEGDHAAFEKLVRRYDRAVLRLALCLTGSQQSAQDIYQEAFLRVYRNLQTFNFESSFYTWLYRIAVNLCTDHFRREKVQREDPGVGAFPDGTEYSLLDRVADVRPGSNPERQLMARELGRRIALALRRLTARERLVIELRHYEGLRLRTVARILNASEACVRNLLFRATHKLRAALAGAC